MPIERSAGGTMITGNAINWFQVRVCASAMQLYLTHGIQASRVATPANLRRIATQYTGRPYKRSRQGLALAHSDLVVLLAERHPDEVTPHSAS